MVGLVVGMVLLWGADQPIFAAVLAIPGAFGVTAARVLDSMASTRTAREHAAAYITLVEGTGPVDVEHVDPRTGRLVSFAGEDLTRAERAARVAAIRADARHGGGRRGHGPPAIADEAEEGVDEELFAGRPRTFVTLPWSVRQGVVWGWMLAALAPLGFFVVELLAGYDETRFAAPIVLGVVLASAVLGGAVMMVASRRADDLLRTGGQDRGEHRPSGGGTHSRGLAMSVWITVFGLALPLVGGAVYGTYQSARLAELASDGVRITAHDAEFSRGRGGRNVKVRAVVEHADGARQVHLDYHQDPYLPGTPMRTWTDAPAPYAGTFTVVQHPEDTDLVVAGTDLADAGDIATEADLGRAAVLSAAWGVPWFVTWLVLASEGRRRSAPDSGSAGSRRP
ncbi:hypothetical protein ACFS27_28325 [Promicromonospora vindobonensis]|uniref:DUF3592 domain-containing protein n=1 Tax=Promicromonospora vindobonensis TaxID=195748 RepID=A0ABW5W1Y1_9MICO